MTESELYQTKLKPDLTKKGVFFHRVECARLPDLYMACNGNVLWGELKCVNKRSNIIKPDWRPGQLAWIMKNASFKNFNICLILYYTGSIYYLEPKQVYMEEKLICQKKVYLKNLKRFQT